MSQQISLLFEVPRSRRSDPPSSKRAEDQMRRSGAMSGQRATCLELVKQHPGKSSKELGKFGTLERHQIARRLPELEAVKLVYRVQTGSEDAIWYPRG